MFENYINSFSRDVKFEKSDNIDESEDFSSGYEWSKYSAVTYTLGFDVPSNSIDEAIRNLGKLQILCRMAAKKKKSSFNSTKPRLDKKIGQIVYTFVSNETDVSVYVPGMIETSEASRGLNNTSYDSCLKNSVGLSITTIDIKFSTDMGFFEKNGKLYPKHYTINLTMIEKDMSLAKNFSYKEDDKDATGGVNTIDPDTALLFPFNRKYTKITTG